MTPDHSSEDQSDKTWIYVDDDGNYVDENGSPISPRLVKAIQEGDKEAEWVDLAAESDASATEEGGCEAIETEAEQESTDITEDQEQWLYTDAEGNPISEEDYQAALLQEEDEVQSGETSSERAEESVEEVPTPESEENWQFLDADGNVISEAEYYAALEQAADSATDSLEDSGEPEQSPSERSSLPPLSTAKPKLASPKKKASASNLTKKKPTLATSAVPSVATSRKKSPTTAVSTRASSSTSGRAAGRYPARPGAQQASSSKLIPIIGTVFTLVLCGAAFFIYKKNPDLNGSGDVASSRPVDSQSPTQSKPTVDPRFVVADDAASPQTDRPRGAQAAATPQPRPQPEVQVAAAEPQREQPQLRPRRQPPQLAQSGQAAQRKKQPTTSPPGPTQVARPELAHEYAFNEFVGDDFSEWTLKVGFATSGDAPPDHLVLRIADEGMGRVTDFGFGDSEMWAVVPESYETLEQEARVDFVVANVFNAIKNHFGEAIPVGLFCEHDHSSWTLDLLHARPKAFSAYYLGHAKGVARPDMRTLYPPGLIHSPVQDRAGMEYANKQRKQNQRVARFSPSQSASSAAIGELFLTFLGDAISSTVESQWIDITTLDPIESMDGLLRNPAQYTWQPSEACYDQWRAITNPMDGIDAGRIRNFAVETGVPVQPELKFLLRLPPQGVEAQGVMCYSLWAGADRLGILENDQHFICKLADAYQLAVLTWNTKNLWPKDSAPAEVFERTGHEFDLVSDVWGGAIDTYLPQFGLPTEDLYMIGLSAGSSYGLRLGVRQSYRFAAIHVHIPGFYVPPIPEGKDAVWLLSTGELDAGFRGAKRFFADARRQQYPIMIKAGASLGHSWSPAIEDLSWAFIDEVVHQRETHPDQPLSSHFLSLLQDPPFVGDFINHEIFATTHKEDYDWIPKPQLVPLPSPEVAAAWGKN